MTKTFTYIAVAALALMTLTACGSDANGPEPAPLKESPDFTASIGDALSRALDDQWERADEIGISGAGRSNVCYSTADGDGVFTVRTTGDQIYFQNDDEVTFNAYYPWRELAAGTSSIEADTRQQEQQKQFDFLWAEASGMRARPNVVFNFAHQMSKVVLTVKPGSGMSFDEVKAALLSLEGFCHEGSFSVEDGIAAVDDGADSDKWQFADATKDASYIDLGENSLTCSLILFPQMFETPLTFTADFPGYALMAKIDFTAANRKKDGDDARNEWVAGRQYNLSLTLHKTELTLDVCTINRWNEVIGDDINVD